MDFNYTDDQRMLSETLNRFLEDNYSHDHRMQAAESVHGYNTDTWQELCELGIAGALLPESCGGYGGSGFDISVVFEALGRSLVVEPFLSTAAICANLLNDCNVGSTAQGNASSSAQADHSALVEKVIAGEATLALACYEKNQRYTLTSPECAAEKQASGWSLSGAKTMVMNGDSAEYMIVTARSGTDADLAIFLVPKSASGLSITPYPTVDGGRACDLQLDGVTLPDDALLYSGPEALNVLELAIARANIALSAEALGAMETCKNMTVEYLQTRKQFGVPIGKFQALQHRMVDVMIEIEQGRSALINAAASLDDDRLSREKSVSALKNLIGRAARLVAEESIQMHGGIAMTWEYSLAHYAKRLIMIDHWFGDTDYHLQRFINLSSYTPIQQ